MLLDLRAEKRPGLLGRSDTLAMLEIYVEKAVKQLHIAVPIVTGPEGMGRSAVLHELLERSRNTGRTGGYGCVRSGLGQALIDATSSLAVSIKSLYPDSTCTGDLIAAAEAFRGRSPDEATEEGFVSAIDHLLYALCTALAEVPRGYVLCIDDLQLANDGRVRALLEGLIALSSTGAPIPVVLTSSIGLGVRIIPQGLDQLQLRPLTNADLADIAQRQGVIATPEVIRQIGDFVEGRPGRAIEIIERASAKGLVDAHTVRAVIAESKILGAERSAAADAERIAAQVRTAPDIPEDAASKPSASSGGFDRTLPSAHTDHVVTKSQVYLDGLEFTDPTPVAGDVLDGSSDEMSAVIAATVQTNMWLDDAVVAPDYGAVSVVSSESSDDRVVKGEPSESSDEVPELLVPLPEAEIFTQPSELPLVSQEPGESIAIRSDSADELVPVAQPADSIALPVRQGAPTRFGATTPSHTAATPELMQLTPTQRRVLDCVAELGSSGGSTTAVKVSLVKRSLGEVSRFGGAASPVGDALTALSSAGLLALAGETVSLTELGHRHAAPTTAD